MSATLAPFGFRPSYNPIGLERAKKYTIAGGFATAIFKGQPVILNTNGTITNGAAAADLLGVFAGVEYVDATGKPTVSNFWPAAQAVFAGSVPTAWVYDDPNEVYEVQADGSIAQTAIGDQADYSNVNAGSISTGLSAATLSATLAGAGVQAQWRIVGFGQGVDNTPGDAFTVVQVQLARSQFVANKVAV
jgi:hypothetical protein